MDFTEERTIDTEKLRHDLAEVFYAGALGGGMGAMLLRAFEIERMPADELISTAVREGLDLSKYRSVR